MPPAHMAQAPVSPAGTGSRHGGGPSVSYTCTALLSSIRPYHARADTDGAHPCRGLAHGPSPPAAPDPLRASRPLRTSPRVRGDEARAVDAVSEHVPARAPAAGLASPRIRVLRAARALARVEGPDSLTALSFTTCVMKDTEHNRKIRNTITTASLSLLDGFEFHQPQ